MRAVNLLPRPEAKARKFAPSGSVLAAACAPVVAGTLIAGGYMVTSGTASSKQTTLVGLESELTALPEPTPADPTNVALSREADERVLAVGAALADRVAVDRVLREISLVLPEDVWLSGLTIKSNEALDVAAPAPAPAPETSSEAPAEGEGESGATPPPPPEPEAEATAETSGFVLIGYTYSQEGVARMLSRLAVLPHLRNVQLAQSLSVAAGKRSVVQFTILADLRTPGASS